MSCLDDKLYGDPVPEGSSCFMMLMTDLVSETLRSVDSG